MRIALVLPALTCALMAGAAEKPGTPPASRKAPRPHAPLSVGGFHSCVVLDTGAVKCWGVNDWAQLGAGDKEFRGDEPGEMGNALPAVSLGKGRKVVQMEAGVLHTCALLDTGAVKCWGYNEYGPLGLGDTNHRGDEPGEMGDALPAVDLGKGRTAVQLAMARHRSCAILDTGAVKCWGYNDDGQLGIGATGHRGDAPGEMGDALPAVDLGKGRTAVQLVAGLEHACALLDTGAVKCWGVNEQGQLGLGDSRARGATPEGMGDALPAVDLGKGRTVVQLAAGEYGTCAILDTGAVKCWGSNYKGRLGLGDDEYRGDAPGEMGDALPTVDLGPGRTAVQLAVSNHTCALLDTGAVKCWGGNSDGQLGLGDTEHRGDGPDEMGDALPTVDLGKGRKALHVAVGSQHTCVVLDTGAVKCWGQGRLGQLGLGDAATRGANPGELGDALPTVDLGKGRTAPRRR